MAIGDRMITDQTADKQRMKLTLADSQSKLQKSF
jgi:hypothetical protein